MIHVVLVEPEIPQNTGNIGRLCVATRTHLHLVKPLGFEINDTRLKRAGLDYWPHLTWTVHETFGQWCQQVDDYSKVFYMSTKAKHSLYDHKFEEGNWYVFGPETRGLNETLLKKNDPNGLKIPFWGQVRSLNLANSVAITVYEGMRQLRHN